MTLNIDSLKPLCLKTQSFAIRLRFNVELLSKLETKPDNSNNDTEWEELIKGMPHCRPASKALLEDISDIVVVDKKTTQLPKIIAAHQCNLQRYGFSERASDNAPGNVLHLLIQHTPLLNWTQATEAPLQLPNVDRTVVLLKQISPLNKYGKFFGIQLGRSLQAYVPDINRCVAQMSQPHVHRRTNSMFQ
jgi:hypothetical protein